VHVPVNAIGKKSRSVFFFPKLSLNLICFGPSAVFVGNVKSGALVPIESDIENFSIRSTATRSKILLLFVISSGVETSSTVEGILNCGLFFIRFHPRNPRFPFSSMPVRSGSATAPKQRMRGFLIFVIVVGLGYFFLRQKQSDTAPATGKPVATQSVDAKLTPAPRGQASEYNWMKRSLDRARDVTEQSRAQTQDSQKP
jgi:hypothetical protein